VNPSLFVIEANFSRVPSVEPSSVNPTSLNPSSNAAGASDIERRVRLLIDTLKSNPEPSFPRRGKGKFPATAFPASGPMQSVLFIADGLAEVTGGGMQQERADVAGCRSLN